MRAAGAAHPLLRVAAVAAGLASGVGHAAEWTVAPSGALSTEAQRNPLLSPDPELENDMATGLSAEAALNMQRRTERLHLAVAPSFRAYRSPDNSNLDRNERGLDLSFNWLAETLTWSGNAGASRDTTLTSELGSTGLTQGNFRHESYDISFGPTWQVSERLAVRSRLSSQAHRYPGRENSGLDNYRYTTASGSMSYVLSDRVSVSLIGSAGKLLNEGLRPDSENSSVSVMARYAWSPLWTLAASAGPSWVKAEESGERNRGLIYSVDISRSFEMSNLSLGVSRSQAPSGFAILTEVEQTNLAFRAQVTERLGASVAASTTRRTNALRQFGVDLQRVRYSRAEAGLSWRFASNWQLGASVFHSVQETGSVFFDDLTGRGSGARFVLSWNGDPYVN